VLAKATFGEATTAQEARREERDETARQDGGDLDASKHSGAMQDGEPAKC